MEPLGIEKAESLGAIPRAFRLGPLNAEELARFYCDKTMAVRTGDRWHSPTDDLYEDCTTPFGRNAKLLLGQRGCGKSTELCKLKQRLEDAGWPVWIINAEAEMDLFQASCRDVMLGIAEGLRMIAGKHGIELPHGAPEPNASCIMEISDRIAKGAGGKQPVLIFDGIDKLQPQEKALDMFRCHALAQMPFPVIYTFPLSLRYDSRFALIKDFYELHILPMIKVSNIDRSQSEEGIGVIREIVRLRADAKLFSENALAMLIEQTGGVLRDLFACIIASARRASKRGSSKIEAEDARRALQELSSELNRGISGPDYPMLASIYNDQKFKEQIEDSQFLIRQMQALVVLEFGGTRWHEVHPLIAEFLIEQGFADD
ncbi:MAG: hypothetical protein FWG42_02810 [Clostridiales bacterium]|nr:hypothetical protein [Clostridiales bacterium]